MTRKGCIGWPLWGSERGSTRRTVKEGLSAWTVPRPMRTASESRRRRCTMSKDSGEVNRSDSDVSNSATPPFRSTAIFKVTPKSLEDRAASFSDCISSLLELRSCVVFARWGAL